MDQGIINEVKKRYRSNLVRKIINQLDRNESNSVDVLQAIFHVSIAWKEVGSTTIKNCFLHAQLFCSTSTSNTATEDVEMGEEMPEMEELALPNLNGVSMEDYFHVDDNVSKRACNALLS